MNWASARMYIRTLHAQLKVHRSIRVNTVTQYCYLLLQYHLWVIVWCVFRAVSFSGGEGRPTSCRWRKCSYPWLRHFHDDAGGGVYEDRSAASYCVQQLSNSVFWSRSWNDKPHIVEDVVNSFLPMMSASRVPLIIISIGVGLLCAYGFSCLSYITLKKNFSWLFTLLHWLLQCQAGLAW